jgi:hypothetical protein
MENVKAVFHPSLRPWKSRCDSHISITTTTAIRFSKRQNQNNGDMSMSYDAIDNMAGYGYAEREAAFLYMVAAHSGYFLRRHFNQFVARERGAIATHFLRKAAELGHVTEMPCSEGRRIYHLADKQVYRMAGLGTSQNRRLKSAREILRRLMILDYILLHLDREHFVETPEARHQLFIEMKVRPEAVEHAETFGHVLPVSYAGDSESQVIRFAFIDEGQRSTAMFARFLATHSELLRVLQNAEVVYVATSPAPFTPARHLFERNMPLRNSMSPACPLGVEHLVQWLEVRHRFHETGGSIQPSEHRLLLEGEHLYTAPVHKGLIASWKTGAMNAGKVRELFRSEQHRVSFVTELLDTNYPQSIDPTAGYTPGYDEIQKPLFDNDLAEAIHGGQKN